MTLCVTFFCIVSTMGVCVFYAIGGVITGLRLETNNTAALENFEKRFGADSNVQGMESPLAGAGLLALTVTMSFSICLMPLIWCGHRNRGLCVSSDIQIQLQDAETARLSTKPRFWDRFYIVLEVGDFGFDLINGILMFENVPSGIQTIVIACLILSGLLIVAAHYSQIHPQNKECRFFYYLFSAGKMSDLTLQKITFKLFQLGVEDVTMLYVQLWYLSFEKISGNSIPAFELALLYGGISLSIFLLLFRGHSIIRVIFWRKPVIPKDAVYI